MNGEAQVLQTDVVIFPIKLDETEVSEIKQVEVKKVETLEVRAVSNVSRFARLKKSLRKRSASIL